MSTNKMTNQIADMTLQKTARIAGFMYLMYIITSIIANQLGHFAFADAATVINNIIAHELQFRIGLLISLFSVVFFLLAAWALYVLLESVNKNLALLFLLLNLGGFVIWSIGILNLFTSLQLLSGTDYLKVFSPDQLQAQALLFFNLHKNGTIIAQIPYGLWVLPLGYLIFKSGFLPKALGILLMVDCVAILIWFFQFFLLPNYPIISYPCWAISFLAEFGISLWLLIKGVKIAKQK